MKHDCCCSDKETGLSVYFIAIAAAMLGGGMLLNVVNNSIYIKFAWYFIAYLLVGWSIMRKAWEAMVHEHDFFSEFTLMTIAAIGAFIIGEYPEGVAVILLYSIGEMLQDRAVERARNNIKSMVALRPDVVSQVVNERISRKNPGDLMPGDVIEVKSGERVALDGVLISDEAAFNTAALTGESLPRIIANGGEVLAGMIATDSVVRIKVKRVLAESAISRILNMLEDASNRKAQTELFIRKFARMYTPIVIILAIFVAVLPYFYSLINDNFQYVFAQWLHRALIFLVVSCPCAMVISIPLSYFAGIGAASKRGILFKGSNYLDAVTKLDTIVFDKTGTLTTGDFEVKQVVGLTNEDMQTVAAIEQKSTHPIGKAIVKYVGNVDNGTGLDNIKSIAGYGLSANGIVVGTLKLLERNNISYPKVLKNIPETIVAVAKNGEFKGYILLSDSLKDNARQTICELKKQGINHIEILSGDKQELIDKISNELEVDKGYGNLLPEDKVKHIAALKSEKKNVAFVGDGINDAPAIALSDVGFAMGAMGTDVAIETADVILQTDQPSKIVETIRIGKRTRTIVKQNITLALGIKLVVMVLGLFGFANLWEAVFADSGVTLLAVFNAARIFIKK